MKKLKARKINQNFVSSMAMFVLLLTVGIWLYINNDNTTFTIGAIKYLPHVFIFLSFLVLLFGLKSRNIKGGNFSYDEKGIKNQDTFDTITFKDCNDLFYVGQDKSSFDMDWYAGIAFRRVDDNTFTVFTRRYYDATQIGEIESLYNNARTAEVIKQLAEGKTVNFSFIPMLESLKNNNLYGLKANLNVKSEPIQLTQTELTFRNKKYLLKDIAKIGERKVIPFKDGQYYTLKTKSGETLFDFEKFNLMSYEVFIHAVNEFTEL